jgi:hypothetical protein
MAGRQEHRDAGLADTDGGHGNQFLERVTGSGQSVGQAEVKITARYRRRDIRAGPGLDGDAQARHSTAQLGQRRREGRARARERGDADDQAGGRGLRHSGDVGPGRVQAEQDGLRVL